MTRLVTPELSTVIREAIRYEISKARVEMPARVEKFNADEGTVDVYPLVRDSARVDGEWVWMSLPVIPRVPIAFMRWNGFVLRCPIAVGDIVSVRCMDRELETWMDGDGGEVSPQSRRAHSLTDAVAVPAPAPYAKAVAGLSDGALVLGREDGQGELRVEADGSVRIGPKDGVHAPAARQGDEVVVDASTDAALISLLSALQVFMAEMAVIPPGTGGPYNAPAVKFQGTISDAITSITGKITTGSDNVEVS